LGRGKERLVPCGKCGRLTRKDKVVCIEKVMLTNPVERKDVYDDQYQPRITREVCYCPSCGKHLRVYEKKTEQNERARERKAMGGYRPFDTKTGVQTSRGHGQPKYD
jgi:ribosomal protein S26